MEKPWKVLAAFIGVFIAGAVFGGFFTLRNPPRRQAPVASQQVPEKAPPAVAGPTAPGVAAQPKAAPITPQLMRQFSKSLKLSTDQKEKLQPVVGRAGEDFQRLREEEARRRQEHLADVARVNERMYVDISNLLTDDQRAQLQKMRQHAEERVQAERQKRADELAAAKKLMKEMSGGAASPDSPK
jgi:hypothetical protein